MISQDQLHELLNYQNAQNKVLSLYLDTNNTQASSDTIKLQMRGLLKEVQSDHPKDVAAIEHYMDLSYDWNTSGLAIFSANDGDFFRVYPANVAFRNRIRVAPKPYVKPLAHLLDHYAHYGVILVDRIGARFFEYHLGELQAQDGFAGEDVHKQRQGRGSSTVGMRGGVGGGSHDEEVARRNLRESAAAAADFFNGRDIRRLFLGGTPETTAQFRDELPKQMQSCLADTFAIEMTASEHEVRELTLKMLNEANAAHEAKLVDKMLAAQASGGSAVIGLDDTLQAISDRRVETLVISDGFRAPGYIHSESGYIVANLTKSPLSPDELTPVEDVIDTAVNLTMSSSGHVEVIADNVALEEAGRIGALLRY